MSCTSLLDRPFHLPLRLLGAAVLAWGPALPVVQAATASIDAGEESGRPERLTRDQRSRIREIKDLLERPDADVLALVDELVAMGPAGHRQTSSVLRTLLDHDERNIESGARTIGDPEAMQAHLEGIAGLREQAWANLKELGKGEELQKAKEYHQQLAQAMEPVKQAFAIQLQILEAIGRRQDLLERYRQVDPDDDRNYQPEDEAELLATAEEALNADLATIRGVIVAQEAPEEVHLGQLWRYRQARRIEAYNQALRPQMSEPEWDNLVAVNDYREYLGVRPYEADPRLIQSARRHSKQMVDMNFFGHSGKTPDTKSHTQRMSNAGYKGGYSENCHMGSAGGVQAFWCWFSSPPHHKNMVNPGNRAIGIGKWGAKWTQNMGRGKSLMEMSASERDAHPVKGELLPPEDQHGR